VNAVRFVVSGRVQGVGFRWFVMRKATELDLGGYVQNLADGSVEVVARGTARALAALEVVLAQGPPSARVARVDKYDVSQQMNLTKPFDIK
jgi:acylphosphatase